MKRAIVLLLFLLPAFIWAIANTALAQNFVVVNQTENYIDVKFNTNNIEYETITENNQKFTKFTNNLIGYTLDKGKPELPVYSTFVAVPVQANVEIELLSKSSSELKLDYPVYPSQGAEVHSKPVDFVYNNNFYNKISNYPNELTKTVKPSFMRDLRLLNLSFVAASFKNGVLMQHTSAMFRIHLENSNNTYFANSKISKAFEKIYKGYVINYSNISQTRNIEYQQPTILVIYRGSDIDTPVNKYVKWKKQLGFNVIMADDTVTGTSSSSVKAYIQNLWNTSENKPEYIALMGDPTEGASQVPTWWHAWNDGSMSYNGEGDGKYTHLEGSDTVPDAFIGRMSGQTSIEMSTIINKIIKYELRPNMDNSNWWNNQLLVGDTAPSGVSTIMLNKYVKENFLRLNPFSTFDEIYNSDPDPDQVNNYLEGGCNWFNFRGYVGMAGWYNSRIEALNNSDFIFNAVIPTCGTGDFADESTTQTEAVIKAGSPVTSKGGVSAIGLSTTGTHTAFNNCLASGFWYGIFSLNQRRIGESQLQGALNMYRCYGVSNPTKAYVFSHIWNLMGDPSQMVWVKTPKMLNVEYPESLAVGANYIEITVKDENNNVLPNAWVTLWQASGYQKTAFTNNDGKVIFYDNFTALATDEIKLTVSADDYKVFQNNIVLSAEQSLVVSQTILQQNNNPVTNFVPGGTYTLKLELTNNTQATNLTNVVAQISTNSTYVNFTNNSIAFNDFSASAVSTNAFEFTISPTCPDMQKVDFDVNIQSNSTNQWQRKIAFTCNAQNFEITNITETDGSKIDPGETANLKLTLKNIGHNVPGFSMLIARSLDSRITFIDSTLTVPDVGINEEIELQGISASAGAGLINGMQLPIELEINEANGFNQIIQTVIQVGDAEQGQPFGPDAYGYYIYDDEDLSSDAPAYEWIEIVENNLGQRLGITDNGSNQDDVVYVDLPFYFTIYGQQYSEITVASNGYIVFDRSAQSHQRNWRLPGAMGPSPMVAAFWDDLVIGSGGVYCYDDTDNGLFVITWNNVKQAQTSDIETFQIILYSSAAYPTSTSDGVIKMQYKQFGNNDFVSDGSTTHGNYCTVGMQNQDNTVGLEYTYNNAYPISCKTITNETALLIKPTPAPIEDAYLTPGEVLIYGQNQAFQAGSTINLGIKLLNIGLSEANDISATLTANTEGISVSNATSSYNTIQPNESGTNINYYTVTIADSLPNNSSISFGFDVTFNGETKSYDIRRKITNPSLKLLDLFVFDGTGYGNGNGLADPNETVKLGFNFANNSYVDMQNVDFIVSSANSSISIPSITINAPLIPAGKIYQLPISATIAENALTESNIPIHVQVTHNEKITNFATELGISYTSKFYDFENDNGGFMATSGWEWGEPSLNGTHSGAKVWSTKLSSNYASNADYKLNTESFLVLPNAEFSFWHRMRCESQWDGGTVYISNNGGSSFSVIHPSNTSYTENRIRSSNQPGFDGTINWQKVIFDLANYEGQEVIIRFNFTSDGSGEQFGWSIDDVEITGDVVPKGLVQGSASLAGGATNSTKPIINADDNLITSPVNGFNQFFMILPKEESHQVYVNAKGYQQTETATISFALNDIYNMNAISLNWLTPPTELNMGQSSNRLDGWFSYTPVNDLIADSFEVYFQTNSEPYELIYSGTAHNFDQIITQPGRYRFYVQAVYNGQKSIASNVFEILVTDLTNSENTPHVNVTKLNQNYPNPFNPTTTIKYSLKTDSNVSLKIYNIKGQLVKTMVNTYQKAGTYKPVWNGKTNANKNASSGMYFFKLKTKDYHEVKKALLLK